MTRVSSNSHVPANKPSSSSKPQSTEHTSKPEQPQAEHSPSNHSGGYSSGGQKPESKQHGSGNPITGGVDSKTQFLATQNLRNKKPTVKAETSDSGTTKADGNIPDSEDENGLTAQQLNTTGSAAKVTTAEIDKAAGGDKDIEKLLTTLDSDVEGHKELRLALDKGTTYHKGPLAGNVVGLTTTGNGAPVVTLDSNNNDGLNIDTVAHETAHAAYQDMSHAEVYRLGHRVQERVNNGQTRDSSHDPASTPQSPTPQGTGNQPGGGGSTGGSGNAGGGSSGGAGNAGGDSSSFNGGGGSSGGAGGAGGGGGGGPANNTGVNTTIAALPAAGNITDAQLSEIANGDPKIIAALKFMMKDPDGAKLVQMLIQKHGHIVDDESLSGGVVGEAPVGGNNPTVRIKEGSLNSVGDLAQTLFHEFTHVSGDPGDANHNNGNDGHDSVYNAQKAFAQRMGIPFDS